MYVVLWSSLSTQNENIDTWFVALLKVFFKSHMSEFAKSAYQVLVFKTFYQPNSQNILSTYISLLWEISRPLILQIHTL